MGNFFTEDLNIRISQHVELYRYGCFEDIKMSIIKKPKKLHYFINNILVILVTSYTEAHHSNAETSS